MSWFFMTLDHHKDCREPLLKDRSIKKRANLVQVLLLTR